MIKVTKETDYAVLLLVEIARQTQRDGKPLNSAALSTSSNIPQAMVSKTLKALAQAELLSSTRGPQGGYTLAAAPERISMQAVIEALEGPIALTECLEHHSSACCAAKDQHVGCEVSPYWRHINQVICQTLSSINLQMLLAHSPNEGMGANWANAINVPVVTQKI